LQVGHAVERAAAFKAMPNFAQEKAA